MSWGMVAVAGATLVSGVMSSNSAKKAGKGATGASADQLGFERQKYDDWKATYGGLQENLSSYYNSVTPEYYAAVGLEQFQKERETATKRMDDYMAQRGLVGSGIEASLKSQTELDAAETRATIRRDAPRLAAEEQRSFLQIGLGQNPSSGVSAALAQQTAYSQQRAQAAGQAAGQAWAAAGPAVGRAIDAYTNRPTTTGQQMTGQPYMNPNEAVV